MFLDLVRAAGMEEQLRNEGPYTLFVPDDDAFRAVPRSALDSIFDDIDRLTNILNYHIVPGVHSAIDLLGIRALRSLQGEDLTVDVAPEGVLVNNVPITESDAWCTNGICHAINVLLLPPGIRAAATDQAHEWCA
jgi:uncharacterized surface protein with fasciclin (FAS1) repeats